MQISPITDMLKLILVSCFKQLSHATKKLTPLIPKPNVCLPATTKVMNSSNSSQHNATAHKKCAIFIYHSPASALLLFQMEMHSFRDKITLCARAASKKVKADEWRSPSVEWLTNVFWHISLQIYHNHSFICLFAR